MPMIEAVLAEAGIDFDDLDRIAVTTGPGSFTGVRVGVAAARGLALALDIPAVGVGSLDALALPVSCARKQERWCAALDARRGEIYALARISRRAETLLDATAIRVDAIAERLCRRPRPLVLDRRRRTHRRRGRSADRTSTIAGTDRNPPISPTSPRSALAATPASHPFAALCARRGRQAAGRQGLVARNDRAGGARPSRPAAAEIADCVALAEIHASAFKRGWTDAEFEALLLQPGVHALLAHYRNRPRQADRGRASSSTGWPPTRRRSFPSPSRRACRRRGVGKALIEEALRHLYREGAGRIHLEVEDSNVAAISLYRRVGISRERAPGRLL